MLVDTSVLVRTLQLRHPQFSVVRNAVKSLAAQGRILNIVPQNLVELWVVATRPVLQNGLGMTPAIYSVWETLVITHQISGKPAHDAKFVAAMMVHGLTEILTFDQSGFSRFPGINVVNR